MRFLHTHKNSRYVIWRAHKSTLDIKSVSESETSSVWKHSGWIQRIPGLLHLPWLVINYYTVRQMCKDVELFCVVCRGSGGAEVGIQLLSLIAAAGADLTASVRAAWKPGTLSAPTQMTRWRFSEQLCFFFLRFLFFLCSRVFTQEASGGVGSAWRRWGAGGS